MSIVNQSVFPAGADSRTQSPALPDNDGLRITEIFAIFWRYRRFILLWTLVFSSVVVSVLAALYFSGESAVSRMQFKLKFEGAAAGRYPNGVEFSVNEIIAPAVLDAVYETNALSGFLPQTEFRKSLAVVKSDNGYSFIEDKYSVLLSKSNIAPAEYQRLFNEYELARSKFLDQAEYHLVFRDDGPRVPLEIQEKVFADLLAQWARAAEEHKGIHRYQVQVISDHLFIEVERSSEDQLIKFDRLMSMLQRVKDFATAVASLPGALFQRSPSGINITTVQMMLQDLERFNMSPLAGIIRQSRIHSNDQVPTFYLESQLKNLMIHQQELTSTVDLLREALQSYDGDQSAKSGDSRVKNAQSGGGFMPQIGEDFLDRLVTFAGQSKDVEYRQNITDQIIAAGKLHLQAQREIAYYRDLLDEGSANSALSPAYQQRMNESFNEGFNAVLIELKKLVKETSDIYRAVSESTLRAEHDLYTVLGPVEYRRSSTIPLDRVIQIGSALTLLFFCLISSFFIIRDSCRRTFV